MIPTGSIASNQTLSTMLNENNQADEAKKGSNAPRSKWDPEHFKVLTTLRQGKYTLVHLVELSQTKQLYALKVKSKSFLHGTSEIKTIKTEKSLLLLAKREKNPFVVDVFGGFQTSSHVMLYLEFCQGGNLMHHLRTGSRFEIVRARFYAAEVCLALKWFHSMNLLYRSLSLDHILLGMDGHIKLIDFSVSKLDLSPRSKTASFCGTAEFMPPEMLLDIPYNSSIDWWQLGVITYQMLTQLPPFRGEDEDEIYDAILQDDPIFPAYMTQDAIDFIQKLLCRETKTRLGSEPNGAEQVMAHSFFTRINWDDLSHKRVTPPFIPAVASRIDTSNFDEESMLLDTLAVMDDLEMLTPEVQEMFKGFEFSAE